MDFLTRLYEAIRKLVPRIELIQPDEAGIRVTLGTREKVLSSGWYLYWPIIQEIFFATVTTRVKDIRCQSIPLKDGRDIVISGAIKYRVSDIRKAMLEVNDYEDSLEALSLGALLSVVSTMAESELSNVEQLGDSIVKKIREEASGWGLKIQKVYITDLGRTRNIRLLTNNTGGVV